MSFHFGLLGLHFLSFWPFGASFPFILAFWGFISFHSKAGTWGPLHKLPKTVRFLIKFKQILAAARPAAFGNFLPFLAFMSFHFGLSGLHFLSFWPFGPSFPFILAFWAFISFHFGLLGLHFLSFWPFKPSFPFIFGFPGLPPYKLPKTVRFLIKFKQILSAAKPAAFCNFWPFGLHFLSFWLFGPSFPFILAFWAFISFHFGLLGLHFLSFWPFGPSFPFILAFWAFISFHFGLLGLYFLSFLASRGCHVGSPPTSCQKRSVS